MCHMFLSVINMQTLDKTRLRDVKVCGGCDNFREDDAFDFIGICSVKNVYVSRYQLCTLSR